jgi:hypothetical protein
MTGAAHHLLGIIKVTRSTRRINTMDRRMIMMTVITMTMWVLGQVFNRGIMSCPMEAGRMEMTMMRRRMMSI